ncbi:Pyruvate/2-oxoglutarate dehydrogenase complex, dihydrolipoamide dehydrogenase (E3) component [Malonomonas rubra DSM 5091]|uniref:Pyruvate/2-oxoglutarate dehydrogenase complex, dihydrolipoamide dehydrogenase (E3) component n=1 Tax=Malonomonas rubra DSM 5091 TaxID=1122189 RepID=A0A1M6MG44_MALRU|nr:NAD(P)/FAD-dependent oxidoreductase [Malonomonas rubra]SHJ82441.1 Pyruvate/2-oxoglutarate dehydrogenase complex, dihydrolipoamide dehydrogenase (E3) component [Malonomonas rubra DSM 5091]
MKKNYDMIVIGLGPAGMALAVMGSNMGLNVLGIEKDKLGGECLNSGCIPSKSLLKIASVRRTIAELKKYALEEIDLPLPQKPFEKVQDQLKYINEKKTAGMFDKVELLLNKGPATFVDSKTIQVAGEHYRANQIYIATGTKPFIPPIPGLDQVPTLTNENLFELEEVPSSLFIIGGGAIGCEMAQAFARLGTKVVLAHMDEHLLPMADTEAAHLLEEELANCGVEIHNATSISKVAEKNGSINLETSAGKFSCEKLLVAAGRKPSISGLELDNAGIKYSKKGIDVDDYGRTNVPGIWAVGDCNGKALLSHAAMHQGMLSLMSSIMPFLRPFKFKYDQYLVPWSVFTEPEVAQVGKTEKELQKDGIKYEAIKANYADYGRTITDGKTVGFVKVLVSPFGKIYGATVIGEAAGEIIHEYILAMHKKIRLHDIMLMQHSFPTVALLNKRVAEIWMMKKMSNPWLQRIVTILFRGFKGS